MMGNNEGRLEFAPAPSWRWRVFFTGPRLLRGFACWCARGVWDLLEDGGPYALPEKLWVVRRAVQAAEGYVERRVSLLGLSMRQRDALTVYPMWVGPWRFGARGSFAGGAGQAARFACTATCARSAFDAARGAAAYRVQAIGLAALARHPAGQALGALLPDPGAPDGVVRWDRTATHREALRIYEESVRRAVAEQNAEFERRQRARRARRPPAP